MTRNIRQVLDNGTAVEAEDTMGKWRPGIVTTHTVSREAFDMHSDKADGIIVRFTDEEGGHGEYSYSYIDPENWDNSLVHPLVRKEA
jgi:hypothetical protein